MQPDSLVLDLMFKAGAEPKPEALIEALGGEEAAQTIQLFDPDAADPRVEMQLSPSMPFRRRGERRLMLIDASVAPMREDPGTDPVIPIDLRDEKERLIRLVETLDCRVGRIMALGSWGDAVLVARSARDLRGVALISWVLDPVIDVEGRKRAQPLGQADIEAKIYAYEKRLDELDEKQILASTGHAKFERRGDLLVLDVLESDGTWDQRKSYQLETALAAVDRFSLITGAPQGDAPPPAEPAPPERAQAAAEQPAEPPPEPPPAEQQGSPLGASEVGDRVVLVFPDDRWDLDIAAALGKRDWDSVVQPTDAISGQQRDKMHTGGAGFIARLEFLSEVFVDGKPLSRPQFDETATAHANGVRSLRVHCPRFGAALLFDTRDRGRFITSETEADASILDLMS